jgi:uncharacterized protein (TIGR01777 family)
MLPAFRLGLGGRLGAGHQYLSWIGVDDLVEGLYHLLQTESLRGAVNLAAPRPVTNAEFSATLGRVLHRPTGIPVPSAAVRFMAGQMGDELLLAGARVIPERLQQTGYAFRHGELEGALRHVLGR